MANFKKLMEINGAVLAGEFSENGQIVAYEGEYPLELVEDFSKYCAENRQLDTDFTRNVFNASEFGLSESHSKVLHLGGFYLLIGADIFLLFDKEKVTIQEAIDLDLEGFHQI